MTKFYNVGDNLIVSTLDSIIVLDTKQKLNISCAIADALNIRRNTRSKRITDVKHSTLTKVLDYLAKQLGSPVVQY